MSGGPPSESSATLGVVITNYETWDLTLRCVEHVLRHAGGVDAVLVADDASTAPPPARLDPRVRLLVNPTNLGLVKTLNRALAEIGTDLVVLFDSDAYPLNDFTGPVRRAFGERPGLGIAGFATVDAEGRPTGSSEPEPGVASLVLGQRLHALWSRLFAGRGRPVSVYACAMALRRQAVLDLGGFDEDFDWLDLDHELCMKARRAGWDVERIPEAVAFHVGGGTPQATSQRVLRTYKNRWLLLRKFGAIRRPWLTRQLVLARLAAESALLAILVPLLPRRREGLRDKLRGRRLAFRHGREHFR